MQWELFSYQLRFKYPFKIAHTLRTETDALYFKITNEGKQGWGEAVFPPYIGQSRNDFYSFFQRLKFPDDIGSIAELHLFLGKLRASYPQMKAGIAGVDIALHNYLADRLSCSLPDLLQIQEKAKPSSMTIGICSKSEMEERILASGPVAYFKLKVSEHSAYEMVDHFKSLSDKPFVVDANQGFTDRKVAYAFSKFLTDLGVAYLEQPFDKSDFESHLWLKERTGISIIADESFQGMSDLNAVAAAFDGVNVKLSKCGGLAESLMSLQRAKEDLGLITVLRCLSESSVAIKAAESLAVFADYLDLDGPHLISNDPNLAAFA